MTFSISLGEANNFCLQIIETAQWSFLFKKCLQVIFCTLVKTL